MKDSLKRFFICLTVLILSVCTALILDKMIDKHEKSIYTLGEEKSVLLTVTSYSEKYGIPEEMIYTVMKMRSNCNRFYDSEGKYGYMGLGGDEIPLISEMYDIEITVDMLRNPSYNLLFGVQMISKLYSSLGDKNAVYAALLYGEDKAAEWLLSDKYTDITGSLTSVPESVGKEFYQYIETEQKYSKLYFKK